MAKHFYEMTIEEILEQFRTDMTKNTGPDRYGRSQAGKQLIRYGPQILPQVEDYLRTHPPDGDANLERYFGLLKKAIGDAVNEVGRLEPAQR